VVGPDYEDAELRVPLERLQQRGHVTEIVGVKLGETLHGKRGEDEIEVEKAAREARADDYDALLIPGGFSPDRLRTNEDVVSFVRSFVDSGKTIAAICHGPQLLIEADAVRGRRMTSWPSVRTDLKNAGAQWVDAEVVEDGALITSRKPQDLEPFSRALLAKLR
jgi:protease I